LSTQKELELFKQLNVAFFLTLLVFTANTFFLKNFLFMRPLNIERIVVWGFTGILFLVVFSIGLTIIHINREYKNVKTQEDEAKRKLIQIHAKLEKKQQYLDLMCNDQKFFERVVRQKLGYVRPDETIFHFENPK
jgi:cell division protein DivIC